MTTITQTIPSLGSPPLTTDPANFDTRADILYGTSLPAVITATNTWSGQANTVASEVNTNATTATTARIAAEAAEAAAEAAQAAAQSASNATQWVSGQAYVAGNVVWSPSTYLSYRAVGATSGTTDPSQSASWVLLAVDVRRFTNPLAQAVSVQMTAAASGSNGIQQLDNANLDMGTNDFTLHWEGSLPDYTPSARQRLVFKVLSNVGYSFAVETSGVLRFFINAATFDSTVATGLTDNSYAKISASIIRETASAAGSVTFYVNGVQLGAAVSITAAATPTLDNAEVFVTSGTTTVRNASNTIASRLYNRALTAAEVLDLSINGVALADRGASQLPRYSADFSAGTGGVAATNATILGNQDAISDGTTSKDNCLLVTLVSGTDGRVRNIAGSTYTVGVTEKTRIVYYIPSGQAITNIQIRSNAGAVIVTPTAVVGQWTELVFDYLPTTSTTLECRIYGVGAADGDDFYIAVWDITRLGLTSELLASNSQSDTGQIFDTSGNKNHALLPASGATVVGRPVSQTREVRWTNTWAGTNELQYIGGVNQAILPANAYIESIVGTVSGATPHDIIIGDGSDTDRYVTITTGLAAGTTSFTLANRTTDGTNLKLTVDPDTNATMSIAWVISYKTLES